MFPLPLIHDDIQDVCDGSPCEVVFTSPLLPDKIQKKDLDAEKRVHEASIHSVYLVATFGLTK